MRRMHLFEIHDSAWCPSLLRDGLTDFLATSIETFDSYGPIRPNLLRAIQESRATRVIDLCSGGGGPWVSWSRTVSGLPQVLLTDRFPNLQAAANENGERVTYCRESVDASSVPSHLTGFRTIFTAAHHFQPEAIKGVINDAVKQSQPIGIFEFTHRSVPGLLYMLMSFAGVWLLTPKMKRVGWAKLIFTYLIPLIPLMTTFDGVVSCLRTYTTDELSSMADAPGYRWQIGTVPSPSLPVTYLIGIPEECLSAV